MCNLFIGTDEASGEGSEIRFEIHWAKEKGQVLSIRCGL